MGIPIQLRRGTTTEHQSFTGKQGEVTIDTTKSVAVVHNGITVGGNALASESHTHPDVTHTTDGFMSAADKVKLDAFPSGGINYQTIQSNGITQTQRNRLNFSTAFAVTDDSSGNRTTLDLASSGVFAGAYTKVVCDGTGRITSGSLITASDVPLLTVSKLSDFTTQVQNTRLDQFAFPASDLNVSTHKITNVGAPSFSTDAATKGYVDSVATGLTFKSACRVATTANVNISAPGTSIDAVSLNTGDRILLKNQTNGQDNGIYVFNGPSTALTRAVDASVSSQVLPGTFIFITEGTVNSDQSYVLATTGTITLGTTPLNWVQFTSSAQISAGLGLTQVGSAFNVKIVTPANLSATSGGVDLVATGVSAGTYNSITVDVFGRVTAGVLNSYQTQNSFLTALAALSSTGIIVRTAGSVTAVQITSGVGISVTNGDGTAGSPQIAVVADSTTQRVGLAHNGTLVATRQQLNLIDGTGLTVTATDNPGSNRTDVTFNTNGVSAPTASTLALRDAKGSAQFTTVSQALVAQSISASTVTIDLSTGAFQKITLSSNATATVTPITSTPQSIIIHIVQTGAFTFTWPSNVKGGGTISSTPGTNNVQAFYSDGTNLYACSTMQSY